MVAYRVHARHQKLAVMTLSRQRRSCICSKMWCSLPSRMTRIHSARAVYIFTGSMLGLVLLTGMTLHRDNLYSSQALSRHPWLLRALHWQGSQPAIVASPTAHHVLQPDCQALLQGDPQEMAITQQMLYSETRQAKPDGFFVNATRDCTSYRQSLQYLNTLETEQETAFPIAYIVTVHKNVQQLEQLLTAIYTPHNVYCIHVDAKSVGAFQEAVRGIAGCFHNIFVASRLERVVYAGFSRLKADLNCMQDLLDVDVNWRYAINLAGQEYPLKTNLEIVKFLRSLNGSNYVPGVIPTSEIHTSRLRYVHIESNVTWKMERTPKLKSPFPHNITVYFGSAYYFVSRNFVHHVVTSLSARWLLQWFQDVHSPDEFYWATLQRLPDSPGGSTSTGWNPQLRAIKWEFFAPAQYPHCQGQYQRSICVYGIGDLHWLVQRPHLFANKFDLDKDHIVLECLRAWLTQKVKHQGGA